MNPAPPKPAEWSPCNGCGLCCIAEVCPLPESFGLPFKDRSVGPCPVLEFEDGRYWCGLVRTPDRYIHNLSVSPEEASAVILDMLGEGLCDSNAPEGWTEKELLDCEQGFLYPSFDDDEGDEHAPTD